MKPPTIALIALTLALGACGPLVQIGGNDPAPASLLTLTATAVPAPPAGGPIARTDTIGVALPGVPGTLQTLRLPVTTSASEVSYLVGAAWAEQPNRQFQRLLVDTITAAGIPVIDIRQSPVPPARTLTGTLHSFGLDVSDPASPVARVRFDAQIANPAAPKTVVLRRFEATEPALDQTPVAVATALNRAANRVAGEVTVWAR